MDKLRDLINLHDEGSSYSTSFIKIMSHSNKIISNQT